MNDALVHRVNVEQVQGVGAALVAGDGQLVEPGGVGLAAKGDGVGKIRLFSPAVIGEPGVGQLLLHTVRQRLVEQAEVIPQADAVAGQVQGGEGIQEAGRQTAQTAVAQRGLRLHLFNIRQIFSRGLEGRADLVIQPQINQVIGQQLADEEFRADVVQLPALHRANPLGGLLVYQLQKGKVHFAVGALGQLLAR